MSDRTKIAAQAKNIVFVPLNKLKKSPKNVRKIPHTKEDIQALAASIGAVGMIQYPRIPRRCGISCAACRTRNAWASWRIACRRRPTRSAHRTEPAKGPKRTRQFSRARSVSI
jgi:hypothetical protein